MRKLTAVVFAAALVFAGCSDDSGGGGGGGAAGGGELEVVLAAAQAVDDAGTSRFEMTTTVEVQGRSVEMKAEGAFDYANEIGEMTASFDTRNAPGAAPSTALEMIVDGDYVYMKGESIDALLDGAEWGRIDASSAGAAAGQFKQDPTEFLDWLREASGDVEEAGEEDVRGEPTTHYVTELTLEEIAETTGDQTIEEVRAQLGDVTAIPVDVWIDAEGLPRRIELEIAATGGPSGELTSKISVDLFDYGTEVDTEAPEDFEDISSAAEAGTP